MIARLAPVAAALAAVSLGFPEQAENVRPPQHAAFSQHAPPCVDSTRVDEPWSSIVGRNERGGAVVDVDDTSTVERASSSSAWTMTA